ncbi:MAG: DeoR/GlpR family DNA-binding transcription regulator [Solobacterium sp.]|jgi:DeoR/GlpR family transcriptional regulator of sugar metabolism|nr:DeoR/GlpR family DNA-binding transcription regulator [Solobacterium sp.]MCH4222487.1 DeoR/GlpR family DNA-binding transcription regulator [Solobacterium sp.]
MKPSERKMQIYSLLQKKRTLSVLELAHRCQVSAVTVRRDLQSLESQGLVTLSYGAATIKEGTASETTVNVRAGSLKACKQSIAKEASLLIHEGDSIFLDCGTTPVEMIRFLQAMDVTVITNSWQALKECNDFSRMKVILAPGIYSAVSGGTLSSETISFINQYHVDIAFISTIGADIEHGTTVASGEDAQVKIAIMANAKQKVLLLDHTKFQVTAMASFASLADYDLIITDEKLDSELLKELRRHCFKVQVASAR